MKPKVIGFVNGADQSGSTLRVKFLDENLGMGDTLRIGNWHCMVTENCGAGSTILHLHPPIIPLPAMYANIAKPLEDGERIFRRPIYRLVPRYPEYRIQYKSRWNKVRDGLFFIEREGVLLSVTATSLESAVIDISEANKDSGLFTIGEIT